jgi:arylsulfatase B
VKGGFKHLVVKVVESLKATGFLVFTTDNGWVIKMGGNNMPLRGTKGTLYEGGTRGIGFIHSPLLHTSGCTNFNMMHAVGWLPTLMSAIGQQNLATSATDGVDQWAAISSPNLHAPRNEIVYNTKEKPFR